MLVLVAFDLFSAETVEKPTLDKSRARVAREKDSLTIYSRKISKISV